MIRLEGISRTFNVGEQPVHALVDIHEEIGPGEHVAIMGPSGSGKSTLLNIIGCLDRPTAGDYLLDGREIAHRSEGELTEIRRHQIGFVFQFFHLISRLSAVENVEVPMTFAGIPRPERRRRALEALGSVGLGQRIEHRPEQLSGGERQRVALARATVMGPRVLLADEPTGNLDRTSGRQVLDLLDRLNDDGLTLVVVSHDPEVAQRADRIVLLVDGRIHRRLRSDEIAQASGFTAPTDETP